MNFPYHGRHWSRPRWLNMKQTTVNRTKENLAIDTSTPTPKKVIVIQKCCLSSIRIIVVEIRFPVLVKQLRHIKTLLRLFHYQDSVFPVKKFTFCGWQSWLYDMNSLCQECFNVSISFPVIFKFCTKHGTSTNKILWNMSFKVSFRGISYIATISGSFCQGGHITAVIRQSTHVWPSDPSVAILAYCCMPWLIASIP